MSNIAVLWCRQSVHILLEYIAEYYPVNATQNIFHKIISISFLQKVKVKSFKVGGDFTLTFWRNEIEMILWKYFCGSDKLLEFIAEILYVNWM